MGVNHGQQKISITWMSGMANEKQASCVCKPWPMENKHCMWVAWEF